MTWESMARRMVRTGVAMRNQANIDGYYHYFREQIRLVFALPHHLYRKMLAVSMLDTLGRARHPNIQGNQARFLATVEALGNWPDRHRVSLP
jgi:hypothetical protein